MAGLAFGAWRASKPSGNMQAARTLSWLALAVAALAALLPLALPRLANLGDFAGQSALLLMTFALATLVGAQFPLAAAVTPGEAVPAAARLFSADLAGAALGALLVSAWLIPVAGLTAVCLLTAALNVAAAALNYQTTRPHESAHS
jgi:predicted membrane-bound spermidine synthase